MNYCRLLELTWMTKGATVFFFHLSFRCLPCRAASCFAVLCGDPMFYFICISFITHTPVVQLSPMLFPGIPRWYR